MRLSVILCVLLIFVVCSDVIQCLKVIPQNANGTYINKKYLSYGRTYVKRYGRKSPYYLNIETELKHTWGNNVTINIFTYEYLHNEYKRSFVEFHFPLCTMMNFDPYIGKMISLQMPCPAPPGVYYMLNMTVPGEDFPYLWPMEKAKVVIEGVLNETGEKLFSGYIYMLFKELIRKRKP